MLHCRQRCRMRTLQQHLWTKIYPTIPLFFRTIPLFFTVSWATFSKLESRRTLTGCTTIFYFLNGCAWASTLQKMSSVLLVHLQQLDKSSLTSGSSTRPPCRPQAASHICSPRLYRSLPTPASCCSAANHAGEFE